MSRRLLVASGGVPTVIPDPPPGGTPPTGPTGWPATTDQVIASMRPTGRRLAALTVNPAAPITATNKHTIVAAMDQAKAIQATDAQNTGLAFLGNLGPDYRVDIIIAAGTYDEQVGTAGWVNLVGATGDPADVVIHNSGDSGGVIHSFGAIYMEGLTLWSQDNGGGTGTGPKYCWHITGGGTSIAANCILRSTNTGSTGVSGMDGGGGTYTLFYGCDLTGAAPGVITNMHGANNPTEPLTIAWVDCTTNGEIGYSQLTSTMTDVLWSIDTTDAGSPAAITTSGSVTVHTTGTWPVPTGGVSPRDLAYHYPSAIGSAHTEIIGAEDQAAFSPPVGRVYYVPLTITQALNASWHGLVAAAAGGVCGVRMQLRGYGATGPEWEPTASLGTLVSGVNESQFYYRATFYPGDAAKEIAYMAVSIDSGAPSLMGSLTAAVGAYYSDDGGTTIQPVTSGRVPVVRLRSN